MTLDSAILDVDALIRRFLASGQEVDRVLGQAQHARLNNSMLRMISIMEDRVLIGAQTITQLAFISGAQIEVGFVKNCGRFVLPSTQTGAAAASP